ncbi:hypothetical protein V2J09_022774 [Rumex salicifolius]
MGNLSYFLSVEVQPHPDGLFLSQRKYVTDVLHRAQMTDSKQVATPMCASTKLTKNAGYLLSTPTAYRQLVGSLQYLSLTRPDIAFVVNKLSQYMQAPTSAHWASLKRLLSNDLHLDFAYAIQLLLLFCSWFVPSVMGHFNSKVV